MGKTDKLAEPERLVICGVDWTGYLRFLRAFEQRRGYRLTYDRGAWKSSTSHSDMNATLTFWDAWSQS